ncbi:MAG TPA: CBS domain-containing protein [Candidatus Binatia bacterium]|jgi:CBS domain-containing protein
MFARNIMTKEVVTVSAAATVTEAARILTQQQLSGAPVVNEHGQIVGVVSETDIVANKGRQVKDIMSKKVFSITEETPVEEIAALMMTRRIKRLPVMRGQELVGIVSQADIVAVVAIGKHFTTYAPIYDL